MAKVDMLGRGEITVKKDKNSNKDMGPRRVISHNSHKYNPYRVASQS